jgi:hypothetical protein
MATAARAKAARLRVYRPEVQGPEDLTDQPQAVSVRVAGRIVRAWRDGYFAVKVAMDERFGLELYDVRRGTMVRYIRQAGLRRQMVLLSNLLGTVVLG